MTTSNRFLEPRILLGICTLAIFLSGCVTTTGKSSSQKGYSVGPSYGSQPKSSVGNSPTKRTDLSILVLPLDPNIPENSDLLMGTWGQDIYGSFSIAFCSWF